MSSTASVRALLLAAVAAAMLGAQARPAAAQTTGTIRGRVLEATSLRPLSGVQVVLTGADRGSLTNAAGNFLLLNVPPGEHELRAELIGYGAGRQTVTVSAGEVAGAEIQLTPVAIDLDEIVVTGTAGAVSKRTLGNSVTTVDAAELVEKTSIGNAVELLQAKAPGVQILPNSGTPGAAAHIQIRGASSFLGNEPVVYVDGIRYNIGDLGQFAPSGAGTTSFSAQTTSAFGLVDPSNIESIEVLKGPAAATLYGADAAGGVIQIITKKGARGSQPLRFDVRFEQGTSEWELPIPDNYTVCDAGKIAAVDAGGNPVWPGCQGLAAGTVLTDNPLLRDPLALRTGDVQRAYLSARGGSDRFSYYLSASRDLEEGVFNNSHNDRLALRANFVVNPSDVLDFQISSSYVQADLRSPVGDESAQGMILSAMRGRPGRVPPAGDPERAGWSTTNAEMANAYNNTTENDRFTIGTTVNYRPFSWFRNRLTLGIDYMSGLAQVLSPPGSTDAAFAGEPQGIVAQRRPRDFIYTADYSGSVDVPLGESWRSTTSVGAQAISETSETLFAAGRGFGAPDVTLIGTAQVTEGSNVFVEEKSLGYYVQEMVGWEDRLFLTGALRFDDHSAFGTNFDLIVYPKASLSWILSEEPALDNLFETARVENFKFRAAYGHAGRAPDPFSASQIYTVHTAIRGDSIRSALRARGYGNPDLRAERGEEFELGFDAGLLEDRLGLELTYYNKRMNDVIISIGVPGSTGFGSTFYGGTLSQLTNLGETLNSGIEASLWGTPVRTENLVWETRLNFATNHNELVDFGDGTEKQSIFAAYGRVQEHRPGHPLAGYWARLPLRNPDGTPVVESGVVQLDTATYIGPSVPTRQIGFSNTVTLFRDFRVFVLFDYKGGHYLYNYKEHNRCRSNSNCARLADPANVNLATGDALNPEVLVWRQNIPGAWIEKADFIKLRDVSLSYTLPTEWAQRLRASRARLTLAGHNLALWSDYGGIDPETNTYGNRSFIRADIYPVPMTRRLSASLNLSF